MHDTRLELKDGRVFHGPIWNFRPREGWCSLVLDPTHYDEPVPERFCFRDISSMVTQDQRIDVSTIGEQDELQRAREQGWDGT